MSKPSSCIGCPYYENEGPVWGRGNPNAKLCTVAQNPWKDEWAYHDEAGRGMPLVGASGRVYNRNCQAAGIDRDREFTTNIVKCLVPPGQPLNPRAVAQCRPLLERELSLLGRCSTILTLGQEPFNYLTGKELAIVHTRGKPGSRKGTNNNPDAWLRGAPFRGAVVAGRSYTIIPAAHPSYIMRTGFREAPILEADFKKAKRWAEGGGVIFNEHFNYNPSSSEVLEYIHHCQRTGRMGLDIETPFKREAELDEDEIIFQGHAERIDVVGLSADIGEVIGIPNDMLSLLQAFQENRPATPTTVFTFNGGFDFGHLTAHFGFGSIREWQHANSFRHADVMLGLNALYSDLRPKDLAMAMSLFTDMPYTKNLHMSDPDRYNAADTHGTLWAGLEMLNVLEGVMPYAR